ncbi:phage/plasmid-like TIGR03299 family protein [Burkholderia pseudomallei]|nr:phage/plasmid-like TIGR03299 family protein [Burkholderia pseudomallei]CAJ6357369.1 phage/plasmid-like TIGR03299 family protein [Burkholderia pseudomallei]CAK0184737.1 phage/plasmid-like TIGR03299 family protein [Burkholderia pseudomallei]
MHLVQTMAFTGEKPWHGLGNHLPPKQPLQTWAKAAGMDWSIEEAEVRFVAGSKNLGSIYAFPEQKVLYRSDNKAPLSVVSARYQVVQPAEILEFYRDLTEYSGFELETAGVLKDGKKLWALARTGQSVTLKGKDTVNGYVLLATACDGTLATTAQHTSVRVVCNNTLQIALGDSAGAVKVGHRSQFDAQAVKRQLGIAVSSWDAFMVRMKALSERKMSDTAAEKFLRRVLTYPTTSPANRDVLAVNERAIKAVAELYSGRGKGADLASASGTAWGLLNAVTEYVDHHRRARSDDHRRDAAWFGSGATLKDRAWDEALKLVL